MSLLALPSGRISLPNTTRYSQQPIQGLVAAAQEPATNTLLRQQSFTSALNNILLILPKLTLMEFTSLEDIYTHLEKEVYSIESKWELTSAMTRLADKTKDESVKEKIKWECFSFDFVFQNGQVKPKYTSTKEDGISIYSYPSFDDFGDKGMRYLKDRANKVKSDFLLIRYNHILWNCPAPHKHLQHARNAIEAYLRIIKSLNCIKEEKESGRDCLEIMKNGVHISFQAKYKVEEFKKILKSWLFEKGKFSRELKIWILRFMLETPQFTREDFMGALDLVVKIGRAHNKKITSYFFSKEIYGTGLRIAQRFGTDTKIWNKRIGDSIMKMADHRMDDKSRMVPLSLLKEAIPFYKLAGLEKKVKEVEQRYFELKKELRLSKVPLTLSDAAAESLNKYLDAKTSGIIKRKSETIIGYLQSGEDIFPKKQWLKKTNLNRANSLHDFFTTLKFDINNNVSKEKNENTSKEKAKLYESYHIYLRFAVLPFLHRIFIEGIKQDKLNFATMIEFLAKHTWLGQELTEYTSDGEPTNYNWLSLIAPSLLEYFIQTESALRSNTPYTNYVMPIDSLTLKFEGALRDFAKLLNVTTTITGKGNTLREKYIEELLAEKEIQKHFDEDDTLFFNFLFTSKDGMNLRNNIAHCFYRYNNYSFQIMHLLICAFLRIGKYKLS